jgi:hypothetical protein
VLRYGMKLLFFSIQQKGVKVVSGFFTIIFLIIN